MNLDGIHHITAITGDAPRNVDFYTRVLGLRMTAKTVNQDDPSVYHLFYGDENAQPGADLTFFEYPGAKPGRPGRRHGAPRRVARRLARGDRLLGHAPARRRRRRSSAREGGGLLFADPEGLAHELVLDESGDEPLIAEHPEIPAALALQGFEGVRAYSARPQRQRARAGAAHGRDAPRRRGERHVRAARRAPRRLDRLGPGARRTAARQSAGTIHHIAWATTDADMQSWIDTRDEAPASRTRATSTATTSTRCTSASRAACSTSWRRASPGFTVDGPVEELGTKLILPPFLEPRREQIAARLTPLPDPRAGWKPAEAAQS